MRNGGRQTRAGVGVSASPGSLDKEGDGYIQGEVGHYGMRQSGRGVRTQAGNLEMGRGGRPLEHHVAKKATTWA